jgi:UDP-N-acetylmuramate dehydrogenase
MESERLEDFCRSAGIAFRAGEPLWRHTSLRIGGPAEMAFLPDEASLPGLVSLLNRQGVPVTILGRGTNVLVDDGGIEGAVIFTARLDALRLAVPAGRLEVLSGCPMQRLIGLSLTDGLSGMEGLAGIPGSLGGAIAGNAGSFGYEVKDILVDITLLTCDGEIKTITPSEASFGYRRTRIPPGLLILGATVSLRPDDPHDVSTRVRSFMKEKQARQPLGRRSAGCVFKNSDGAPAGRLIDEAGCKGMRVGDVAVSELHANYFVNTHEGTAEDFLRLMDAVTLRVRERFGVILEPEIRILGRKSAVPGLRGACWSRETARERPF